MSATERRVAIFVMLCAAIMMGLLSWDCYTLSAQLRDLEHHCVMRGVGYYSYGPDTGWEHVFRRVTNAPPPMPRDNQ